MNKRTLLTIAALIVGAVYAYVAPALVPVVLTPATAASEFVRIKLLIGPFWLSVLLSPITLALVLTRTRFWIGVLVVSAYAIIMIIAWYRFSGAWANDQASHQVGLVPYIVIANLIAQFVLATLIFWFRKARR